jgi:hypothetical protein
MAYDCHYKITLSIIHPDANVQELTSPMSALACTKSIKLGKMNERTSRAARCSVWESQLTEKEWEDNEELQIAETLRKDLPQLEQYKDMFTELAERGSVYVDVVMFAHSKHSVAILPPDVVKMAAAANLQLDLQWYAND